MKLKTTTIVFFITTITHAQFLKELGNKIEDAAKKNSRKKICRKDRKNY